MNIERWFYKISKIIRKCTRHVNRDISYHGHKIVRSRASVIATNKGLGTALLIAPPVLILIATGIAAASAARSPPPIDQTPPDVPVPPTGVTSSKGIVSGIQTQLRSIAVAEKNQDHRTAVAIAAVAVGFIGVILVVRAIRGRGRGGGGRGKNARPRDDNSEFPSGKDNVYRKVYIQTGSQPHEESSTLNAGSGADPFRPR